MTFLHTSDVHIGLIPDKDKPWSDTRSNDIYVTFTNIIDRCRKNLIDLLLISGDLFNHTPSTYDLTKVNELFESIPNTTILIVAGANDYITKDSPILNFNFSSNVFYFMNQSPIEYEIPKFNLVIHAFSYHNNEQTEKIIDQIHVKNYNKTHLLLAYGGDTNHIPIDYNILASKKFTYCALGSKHNYTRPMGFTNILYPGTPEPTDKTEIKEHGIILGSIDTKDHICEYIKFEKICKVMYIPITIQINSQITNLELTNLITKEINKNGIDNIYDIKINGIKNPDVYFDFDALNERFKIINISDNTILQYNYIKLSSEHPKDMIGAYIRKIIEDCSGDLSDIEKNALYYGTNALIQSNNL